MPSQTTSNGVCDGGHLGNIRTIPLSYESTDPDSARKLVLALRPEWASGPDSQVEFVRFTDGITNTLLKAINKKDGLLSEEEVDNNAILLRAYGNGTDVLIDRLRETQNHELLMRCGLAPELFARFNNGMMYQFIRGRPTTPTDLRVPSIYLAVAWRLAQWHATVPCIHETTNPQKNGGANGAAATTNGRSGVDIDGIAPGKPSPNVWTVMQKWILALPTKTEAQQTRQANLQKELTRLVGELSQRPGLGENGLVFAHCDLLCGNVIIEPKKTTASTNGSNSSSSQECVNFIDYEYATPSPAAFDIANHFAEWGGFDCDHGALPTRAQRTEFIQEYTRAYFELLPKNAGKEGGGGGVDVEAEAQKLLHEIDVYRGVPGFYWGIWALIQATISQIDFDYANYAELRLGEYWAWREEEDGSRERRGAEMPLRERRWAQIE